MIEVRARWEAVEVGRGGQDLSRGLELLRRSADSTEAGEERRRRITPIFLAQFLSVCGIELSFKIIIANKSCY